MTSSNNSPPTFPDSEKFDGTNFTAFKNRISMAVRVRGARGYFNGSTPKASTLHPDALPIEPTVWTSTSPSVQEWEIRDAWVLALITYNTNNPVGMGLRMDGTAAEAWNSLQETYGRTSELAAANAEKILRNATYTSGADLLDHIASLRNLWAVASEKGASINDKAFRAIIIGTLPESWNTIVSTLLTTQTSAELIAGLSLHWDRLKAQAPAVGSTTNALHAHTNLVCINTNCGRTGHTIENCYWRGGGKEGQFPPNFRNRGRTSDAPNTTNTTTVAVANTTSSLNSTNGSRITYALMAQFTSQYSPSALYEITDAYLSTTHTTPLATMRTGPVITYADSGASDHCFVERSSFTDYEEFPIPREGQPANVGAVFRIVGRGTVKKTVVVDGVESDLIFKSALHTPDLAANLISIGKFDLAGFKITFGGGKAEFTDPNDRSFMVGVGTSGMYRLNLKPTTTIVASPQQPLPVTAMAVLAAVTTPVNPIMHNSERNELTASHDGAETGFQHLTNSPWATEIAAIIHTHNVLPISRLAGLAPATLLHGHREDGVPKTPTEVPIEYVIMGYSWNGSNPTRYILTDHAHHSAAFGLCRGEGEMVLLQTPYTSDFASDFTATITVDDDDKMPTLEH